MLGWPAAWRRVLLAMPFEDRTLLEAAGAAPPRVETGPGALSNKAAAWGCCEVHREPRCAPSRLRPHAVWSGRLGGRVPERRPPPGSPPTPRWADDRGAQVHGVARKRCLADLAARRPCGCRRGSIQKQLDARFESSADGLRNPIDFTQVWPRSPARGLERLLGQHTRQPITSSGTADGPTLSDA